MKKTLTLLLVFLANTVFCQDKNAPTGSTNSPILQFYPIIVSSLALLFSIISLLFNYYIQYRKKPQISILLSDRLKSWIDDQGKLVCINAITIFNKGAQYGAVYKMKGEIFHKQTNITTNLIWRMFVEDKNVGKAGEQFKAHSSFESWADTILIQGRTAIIKRIQFVSTESFVAQLGDYDIKISVFTGTNRKPSYFALKKIRMAQIELDRLAETKNNFDPINKIAKTSVSFNLKD